MARARNIKPGFFTNDMLAELPALTRLFFAGLWTVCDRAGRVEDRPKKIKAEVMPYDDCDPDQVLEQLRKSGFIARYEADGVRVIQVLTWEKHQNPHVKEAASTLPALCEHGASTVLAPDEAQPSPERAGLIPDSGFLIPDSLQEPGESAAQPAPRKPKARASRKCPDDFALTLDMLDWASQNAPGVNVQAETEKFRDHTFKDPKADWPGTWRNWLRRAAESVGKGVGPPGRQNAPDRVSRQLETAALMTGAMRPPTRTNPTQPAEIVDAEFKLIQH